MICPNSRVQGLAKVSNKPNFNFKNASLLCWGEVCPMLASINLSGKLLKPAGTRKSVTSWPWCQGASSWRPIGARWQRYQAYSGVNSSQHGRKNDMFSKLCLSFYESQVSKSMSLVYLWGLCCLSAVVFEVPRLNIKCSAKGSSYSK